MCHRIGNLKSTLNCILQPLCMYKWKGEGFVERNKVLYFILLTKERKNVHLFLNKHKQTLLFIFSVFCLKCSFHIVILINANNFEININCNIQSYLWILKLWHWWDQYIMYGYWKHPTITSYDIYYVFLQLESCVLAYKRMN